MANDTSRRRKFYDQMSESYDLGSFEEFDKKMNDAASRKRLHEFIDKDGQYDIGTFEYFDEAMRPAGEQPKSNGMVAGTVAAENGMTFTEAGLDSLEEGATPVYVEGPKQEAAVPQPTNWRNEPLRLNPGEQSERTTTHGEVYDTLYKHFGDIVANGQAGERSAYSRTYEKALQMGIDDDDEFSKTRKFVGTINRQYAKEQAAKVAEQLVSQMPEHTSSPIDDLKSLYYNRDLQQRLWKTAAAMGNDYSDYVNMFLKPQLVEALKKKYGGDGNEWIGVRGLFSDWQNTTDELERNDVAALLQGNFAPTIEDAFSAGDDAANDIMREHNESVSPYTDPGMDFGAIGATRKANEERDPDKILRNLENTVGGAITELLQNPQLADDIFKRAEQRGITAGQYIDQFVAPQMIAALRTQFEQEAIRRQMPRSQVEYILRGFEDSIVGMLANRMMLTESQQRYRNMADAMTAEGKNPDVQPNVWAEGGRLAVGMANDFWLWSGWGQIGAAATGELLAQRIAVRAIQDKITMSAARRLIEEEGKQFLSKGVVEQMMRHIPQSAITMAGAEATTAAAQGIRDRADAVEVLGNIFSSATSGATTGTLFGVTGGFMGRLTSQLEGVKRLAGKLAGFGIEASTMYTAEELQKMAAGEDAFSNPLEDLYKAGIKLGFIKLSANPAATGVKLFEAMAHPVKAIREAMKPDKPLLTEDDVQAIRDSQSGQELMDALTAMRPARSTDPDERLGDITEEQAARGAEAYRNFMLDPEQPYERKQKVARLLGGLLPPPGFEVSVDVTPVDGGAILRTRDIDGQLIRELRYDSVEDAEAAIPDMNKDLFDNTTKALERELLKSDVYRRFLDSIEQRYQEIVAQGDAEEALTLDMMSEEDRTIMYLHQHMDEALDIYQKMASGQDVGVDGEKVTNALLRYFEQYVKRDEALKEVRRDYEYANGLKEGTIDDAIKNGTAEDYKLLSEYQEAMCQRLSDLGREVGKKDTESFSDDTFDVRPDEEPSGTEPRPAADATGTVARTERRQAAYDRGTTVDESQLGAVSYDGKLAEARMMQTMPDGSQQEAVRKQIMDAVQSDDVEAAERILAQQSPYLSEQQREAIEEYIDAQHVGQGVADQMQQRISDYEQELSENLAAKSDPQGMVTPLKLKDGSVVYYQSGDLNGLSAVSSIFVTTEDGRNMQISKKDILEAGDTYSADDAIEQAVSQYRDTLANRYNMLSNGSLLNPGQEADIVMGNQLFHVTALGTDQQGNNIVQMEDGSRMPLTPEQTAEAIDAADYYKIQQLLQQEQNAAAEQQRTQRFTDGIAGYAEGTPDLTHKDTKPEVAAEYLLSQTDANGQPVDRKQVLDGIQQEIDKNNDKKLQALQKIQQARNDMAMSEEGDEVYKQAELAIRMLEPWLSDVDSWRRKWGEIRQAMMTDEERQAFEKDRIKEIGKAKSQSKIVESGEGTPAWKLNMPTKEQLVEQYPERTDGESFVEEQRKQLSQAYRQDVYPKYDDIQKQLDDYQHGLIDLTADEMKALTDQQAVLSQQMTQMVEQVNAWKKLGSDIAKAYAAAERQQMTPHELSMSNLAKETDKAKKLKLAQEAFKDDEAAVAVLDNLEPQDVYEYVAENLGKGTINWEGLKRGEHEVRGLIDEMGRDKKRGVGAGYDTNGYNYFLAPAGQGKGIDDVIHAIAEGSPYDTEQVREALLSMLKDAQKPTDISHRIIDDRIAQAEDIYEANLERERELEEEAKRQEEDEAIMQMTGMTPEEYDAYISDLEQRLAEQEGYQNSEEYFNQLSKEYDRTNERGAGGSQETSTVVVQEQEGKQGGAEAESQGGAGEAVVRKAIDKVRSEIKSRPITGIESEADIQALAKAGLGEKFVEALAKDYNDSKVFGRYIPETGEVYLFLNNIKKANVPVEVVVGSIYHENVHSLSDGRLTKEEFARIAELIEQVDKDFNDDIQQKHEGYVKEVRDEEVVSYFVEGFVRRGEHGALFAGEMNLGNPELESLFVKIGKALNYGEKEVRTDDEGGEARTDRQQPHSSSVLEAGGEPGANQEEVPTPVQESGIGGGVSNGEATGESSEVQESGADRQEAGEPVSQPEVPLQVDNSFSARLAKAKAETNVNPTEEQKKAGNYKMGHISFGGYRMSIENPKGSTRSGKDANGRPWSIGMQDTYGYIGKKYGADKDHLDFFINDDADLDSWSGWVYVVDQKNEDGTFDEHKVMYGYPTWSAARKAYERNYEAGWWDKRVMQMTGMPKKDFDKWLADSNRKTKPFADYSRTRNTEVIGDPIDQLLADVEERKNLATESQETVEVSFKAGELEGKSIDELKQLKKKKQQDKSTAKYLMGTTSLPKGGLKERTLTKNIAQADADLAAIDKVLEQKQAEQKTRIEQQEIGGAMVDQLEGMGFDVTTNPSEMRKARKQAEQDNSEEGKLRHMRTSDGQMYGFTYRGKMYLDPRKIDANLPVHEYAHPWCEAFRRINPDGWKAIVDIMRGDNDTWEFVKAMNPDLTNDDDIAEEMIARGSGETGQKYAQAEYERMNQRDPDYKSKWGNIWKNISKAIQDFWKQIGDFLHIKYKSAEQVYDQVVRDFANKINPRKRIEQWLKERDNAYLKAVESGDDAKAKELFDAALRENIGNGMTPYIAVEGYRKMRTLAHAVKERDPKTIAKVADMMAPLIPKDAVLVPAPSHTGNATDMLDLAQAISERTGAPVADVLTSGERPSQYEAKYAGKPIASKDMGITLSGELPDGKLPVVIDNVVDTGNTAEACVQALGKGIVASLADSVENRKHVTSLKSAEPVVTDKNGNVIPLSDRFMFMVEEGSLFSDEDFEEPADVVAMPQLDEHGFNLNNPLGNRLAELKKQAGDNGLVGYIEDGNYVFVGDSVDAVGKMYTSEGERDGMRTVTVSKNQFDTLSPKLVKAGYKMAFLENPDEEQPQPTKTDKAADAIDKVLEEVKRRQEVAEDKKVADETVEKYLAKQAKRSKDEKIRVRATKAVLTAMDNAGVPYKVVSEEEEKRMTQIFSMMNQEPIKEMARSPYMPSTTEHGSTGRYIIFNMNNPFGVPMYFEKLSTARIALKSMNRLVPEGSWEIMDIGLPEDIAVVQTVNQRKVAEYHELMLMIGGDKKASEPAVPRDESPFKATAISNADAKVVNNLEELVKKSENFNPSQKKDFLKSLSEALGAERQGSGSRYVTIEAKNGTVVTLRLADHNVTVSRFDYSGKPNGVSIVVSRKPNEGVTNDGNAHIVEYFYPDKELRKADGNPYAEIVKSVEQMLYSGEYKDTTGIAQPEEVNNPMNLQADIETWHGSGAVFTKFDHSHMSEGAGSQVFGWGTYLTDSQRIGTGYAQNVSGSNTKYTRNGEEIALNDNALYMAAEIMTHAKNKREAIKEAEYMKGKVLPDNEKRLKLWDDIIQILKESQKKDFAIEHPTPMLYKVDIPDDTGENYLEHKKPVGKELAHKIRDFVYDHVMNTDSKGVYKGMDADVIRADIDRVIEPESNLEWMQRVLDARGVTPKEFSQWLYEQGYTGIKYPAGTIMGDGNGATNYVIFNEDDAKIVESIQFMIGDEPAGTVAPIFISNALKAAEDIKQEKATPEQWLKMIEKGGGLKAGEDKWLGLSDWLNEHKGEKLTKQEVINYILLHEIEVLDVRYGRSPLDLLNEEFYSLRKKYMDAGDGTYLAERKAINDLDDRYPGFGKGTYLQHFDDGTVYVDYDYDEPKAIKQLKEYFASNVKVIEDTRLQYTTTGLENKQEIALIVPTIEPYNQNDEIHFGDAGNGRAVAWVRFGETTIKPDGTTGYKTHDGFVLAMQKKYNGAMGYDLREKMTDEEKLIEDKLMRYAFIEDEGEQRVLVIDEIQSKRHQEGRELGYQGDFQKSPKKQYEVAYDQLMEYRADMEKKYGEYFLEDDMTDEERAKYEEMYQKVVALSEVKDNKVYSVPDAPFEKNWHELAMKRMLRYAAENGYNKIAWTTGAQQAERYSLAKVFNSIEREDNPNQEGRRFVFSGGNMEVMRVDDEGKILSSTIGGLDGKSLSEAVGKDLAVKLMGIENGDVLDSEQFTVGGEGMKGFYDEILVRFMNKYGKKWGVQVQDVDLPEIGQKMHVVDVTPEMKESVMQGQPMFQKEGKKLLGWSDGKQVYLTKAGLNPNTPLHECTHLWDKWCMKEQPDLWKKLVNALKKTAMWEDIAKNPNYRNIWNDENRMASEVHSRLSGATGEEEFMKAAFKKGTSQKIIDEVKSVLRKFWERILQLFGKHSKTVGNDWDSLDAIVRMPIRDLVNQDFEKVMKVAGDPYDNAMIGYHGSSAIFDKFDLSKVGTGEGQAVSGHGVYVTSSEGTARYYAKVSSDRHRKVIQKMGYTVNGKIVHDPALARAYDYLKKANNDVDEAIKACQHTIDVLNRHKDNNPFAALRNGGKSNAEQAMDYLLQEKEQPGTIGFQEEIVEQPAKQVYEVDIPDDTGKNYLDLDKKLTKKQKEEIKKAFFERINSGDEADYWKKNRDIIDYEWRLVDSNEGTGDAARGVMEQFLPQEDVSKIFSELGYVGSKVKGSDGTTYIIYNEDALNIKKRAEFMFHIEDDPETVARLDSEPTEKGYRNVVVNEDGTLGSPMANRLGKKGVARKATTPFEYGKWERSDEHPELATEDGKIDLIKPGNKEVGGVDYNPYIHIRPNKVNKQFKEAWRRPELIYVETEYPKSELEGGYQAEKAAKAVGRHPWGNKGEELILSRWDKPVRMVPWKEVADDWEKEFAGRGVEFDIIPPKLLPILAQRGVKILPPHKGMGKACNEAYEAFLAGQTSEHSGLRSHRMSNIEKANTSFNKRLAELDKDRTQKNRVLKLGKPGTFLLAGGVQNGEIVMDFDRFVKKSSENYKHNHPFTADDIKDLPKAVNAPIAVFDSTSSNDKVILTELKKDGHNFIVVIRATEQHRKGGVVLEVNEIQTLFPKDAKGIVKWFIDGLFTNVDKNKALSWIEALQTHPGTTIDSKELDSAAKVIKDFENPKLTEEKLRKLYADHVEVAEHTAEKLGGQKVVFEAEGPEAGTLGWYDPNDNTVHVVLPEQADVDETVRTVFHEKLGHEGLVALLGSQAEVNKFGTFIFRSAGKTLRQRIMDKADENDGMWKEGNRFSTAAQEVFGDIAADGPRTAEEFDLWTKVKHYLIRLLNKLNIRIRGLLNDKDLTYYIVKTGEALKRWNKMSEEEKAALARQAEDYDILRSRHGKPRKRNGESDAQYFQRLREWEKWRAAIQRAKDNGDPEPEEVTFHEQAEADFKADLQEWKERNGIPAGESAGTGAFPRRRDGESPQEFAVRVAEHEAKSDLWKSAPKLMDYLAQANEDYRRAYTEWRIRYDLQEQESVDQRLYEGDVDPAPTFTDADMEAEALAEKDLAEAVGMEVDEAGAKRYAKLAVIERRKDMESANAEDAIWVYDFVKKTDEVAKALATELQGTVTGKELRAALPFLIEADRRKENMEAEREQAVMAINMSEAIQQAHSFIDYSNLDKIGAEVSDLESAWQDKESNPNALADAAYREAAARLAEKLNMLNRDLAGYNDLFADDIMQIRALLVHAMNAGGGKVMPDNAQRFVGIPEVQQLIDHIKDWYDEFYQVLEDAGLRGDAGYIGDGYVNHVWDKEKSDPKAWEQYIENRQRTKSPNMRHREIDTYMDGISIGLVPKYTDIADMIAHYSRQNNEAVANRRFLDNLQFVVVEEMNDAGEVTAILPLIEFEKPSSFVRERYAQYYVPGCGDVYVLKHIQDRFANIFGTMRTPDAADWLSKMAKGYDLTSSTAKKIQLAMSGFHALALFEVDMAQNNPAVALKHLLKYIITDSIKAGTLPAYAHPEDFQLAAKHLVQLGATEDYAAADVNAITQKLRDAFKDWSNSDEAWKKAIGVAGSPAAIMMDWVNKRFDTVLWNYLHDGLKLCAFKELVKQVDRRVEKEGLDEQTREQLLDEAGQYVNDMFGGQYWELINVSPATLKWMRRAFLSPDWLLSTQRHFFANFGFGSVYSDSGFRNYIKYNADNIKRLFGADVPRDELRRLRSKNAKYCYLIGAMIWWGIFYNVVNMYNRWKDEKDEKAKAEEMRKTNPNYKSPYELAYPDGMKWYDYTMYGNAIGQNTHLFTGRYKDGTETYVRWGKQFREFPELFIGRHGLEFPAPIIQRMMSKANPNIGTAIDFLGAQNIGGFNGSYENKELREKYGKTVATLASIARHFIPFGMPTQAEKEYKWLDFFMPSSKGFSRWKAKDYFETFILDGDWDGIEQTYNACVMNGIDAEKNLDAAIASIKAAQKKELADGITDLTTATQKFDAATKPEERALYLNKIKKHLKESEYKVFTREEALEKVHDFLDGTDVKEKENARYIMLATSEDIIAEEKLRDLGRTAKKFKEELDAKKGTDEYAELKKRYGSWLKIHKIVDKSTRIINKSKKRLGGINDDDEVMESIRERIKATQKRIDKIQAVK